MGAQTETELKEKKLRVEDALNATKAAVEEGIVIGGGCTLLKLAAKVDAVKDSLANEEQKVRRVDTGCAFASSSQVKQPWQRITWGTSNQQQQHMAHIESARGEQHLQHQQHQ